MSLGLRGARQVATERRQERFTALLHHLSVTLLRDSFYTLKRLEDRLCDLHNQYTVERIGRGRRGESISRRMGGADE
jgi:hypothetical protein